VTEASGVLNGTPGDATARGALTATDGDSSAACVVAEWVAKSYGTFSIDAGGSVGTHAGDDKQGAVAGAQTASPPLQRPDHALRRLTARQKVIDVTDQRRDDGGDQGHGDGLVDRSSGVIDNGTPGYANGRAGLCSHRRGTARRAFRVASVRGQKTATATGSRSLGGYGVKLPVWAAPHGAVQWFLQQRFLSLPF